MRQGVARAQHTCLREDFDAPRAYYEEPKFTVEFHEEPVSAETISRRLAAHYRECQRGAEDCFVKAIHEVVAADDAFGRHEFRSAALHAAAASGFAVCLCAFGVLGWALEEGT